MSKHKLTAAKAREMAKRSAAVRKFRKEQKALLKDIHIGYAISNKKDDAYLESVFNIYKRRREILYWIYLVVVSIMAGIGYGYLLVKLF